MRLSLLLVVALAACATAHTEPPPSVGGVTYVRVTIANNRSKDAIDPSFYLVGSGRHSLGVVKGLSQPVPRWIDTRWFGADDCMTFVAHYPGGPDFVFERLCWRQGEVISVTLDDMFNRAAAWSHR